MKKPLIKDQRGLGQVVIIVIVLAVLTVGGFVGWRVTQNNKAPEAATTTAGKAVNEACMKIYNDKNVCYAAAVSADFAKTGYTAVDTATDTKGQTSTVTLSNDGKGSSSFTTKASSGQQVSTVIIGKTVYTKIGAAKSWTKYTSNTPASANPASDLKTTFSDAATPLAQRIKYTSLGTEKCGDGNCYKYQVTDPATPGTTTYVWFSTKDYRLARFTTKNTQGTNDFVITYKPVTISTPSPVAASPAASSTPTQAQIKAAEKQAQDAAAQAGQ